MSERSREAHNLCFNFFQQYEHIFSSRETFNPDEKISTCALYIFVRMYKRAVRREQIDSEPNGRALHIKSRRRLNLLAA